MRKKGEQSAGVFPHVYFWHHKKSVWCQGQSMCIYSKGSILRKGWRFGDKKRHRRLVAMLQGRSEVWSLFSSGQVKAAALVELHVPHTTHGLNLRLEGAKLIVVPVVATLKQILVTSVSGVLVSHPTSKEEKDCVNVDLVTSCLVFQLVWYSRSTGDSHAAHSVAEAMRPQGWHIILVDLHLVALEVGQFIQADLVFHGILGFQEKINYQDSRSRAFECKGSITQESRHSQTDIPCGWVWGTWDNHCGSCLTRCPSEDTRPSPGWTSHHGS